MLSFILAFSVYGCGSSNENNQNEMSEQTNDIIENNSNAKQEEPMASAKVVKLNEKFTVGDVMEITLTSAEWCDEILPSNTDGVYSYYADNELEKFFVIHGNLKNLAGQTLDISYAGNAEVQINGKYKLPAVMELEDVEGNSFYGNATPLQTLPLVIYVSASNELYDACTSVQVSLDLVNSGENIGYYYNDSMPHDSFAIYFDN